MDKQTRKHAAHHDTTLHHRAQDRQTRAHDSALLLNQGLVQRARHSPARLSPSEVQTLQRSMGNRAVTQLVQEQREIQRVPQMIQRVEQVHAYDKTGKEQTQDAAWQQTNALGMGGWWHTDKPRLTKQPGIFKPKQQARDRAILLGRIGKIEFLAQNQAFLDLANRYIEAVGKEGSGQGNGSADQAACDQIVATLEAIRGFEVPYRWYVENQGEANFREELLPQKAESAASRGRFWSKLSTRRSEKAAEPSNTVPEGGILLESSVAGALFNGLLFGVPWGASPTMDYLWERLSTSYANHLKGTVEADVLDGRDPRSVLSTHEWHRLRQSILSGKVKSFIVNIHEFRKNEFKVVKRVNITKQNLNDWYSEVPTVSAKQEWKDRQRGIDAHEKMLVRLDSAFRDISEDVKNGKRLLTVEDLRED